MRRYTIDGHFSAGGRALNLSDLNDCKRSNCSPLIRNGGLTTADRSLDIGADVERVCAVEHRGASVLAYVALASVNERPTDRFHRHQARS